MNRSLQGKVAVVTGASRGAGRGIAQVLGEAGATVYVTGRSVSGKQAAGPGTVEATAELVTAAGGTGIPVRCDFTVAADVRTLFEQVKREQGRLDILANAVWGGYEPRPGAGMENFGAPVWKQDFSARWESMFTAGVRARLLAASLAAGIMAEQRSGLIVNLSTGDGPIYLANIFYDLFKQSMDRMTYGLAVELKPYDVAAVCVSPGWMRTEAVLAHFGTTAERWREIADLDPTESVAYVGRAILALATDPAVMEKTGQVFKSGELARLYGFTDVDGRQPEPFVIPPEHRRGL